MNNEPMNNEQRWNRAVRMGAAVSVLALFLIACDRAEPLVFDGEAAYAHVQAQCDLGFRPSGSQAGWATGDYIIAYL